MGSQAKAEVPIIDLSKEKLKAGTEEWASTCKEMRFALEEFGCFSVVYDKVSLELHNSIFEAIKELFHLPLESKIQNTSEKPYHGYYGPNPFAPLYESMGIDNPTALQAVQSFANIMWPAGNNHFCETVQHFSTLMAKLEEMVTRMVFESYGVSNLSDSNIESTNHLFRCFKYRVPEKDETNLGLTTHTDRSFFTTIYQNLVGGVQIQSLDGQWIDVEPSGHCSFIIMAGDALMAWSNERIRSCRHRVIMKGDKTRYSIGVFSFKSGTIRVPEELVDEANPLRYKPFDHIGFLNYNYNYANSFHTTESRIKDYCGL